MRQLRSPNVSSREGADVSLLLMHYTGMQTAQAAVERLCDANAKVSAHYVVEENGDVMQLVAETDCAWHAGLSYWRGHRNVNPVSIGIEIVNPGHEWGYRAFPKAQMQAVAELSRGILSRHPIPPRNVVAHSDVAPQRKEDPGELFGWQWLAGEDVGVWPGASSRGHERWDIAGVQGSLAEYGYEVPLTGVADIETAKVITAFQRHFRPKHLSGVWDDECEALLAALLAMK